MYQLLQVMQNTGRFLGSDFSAFYWKLQILLKIRLAYNVSELRKVGLGLKYYSETQPFLHSHILFAVLFIAFTQTILHDYYSVILCYYINL
jgi:choline-glycine betaine transporter